MLIVGRRHLEYVLKEFVEHYEQARPHQGLDQRTPSGQPGVTPLAASRIVRQDRLGGLGSSYVKLSVELTLERGGAVFSAPPAASGRVGLGARSR